MKRPSVLALIAILWIAPVALCENVTVIEEPQASIQRPQITVLRDDNPVSSARLTLYRRDSCSSRAETKLRLALVTNGEGRVNLPELPIGIYRVDVSAGPTWSGEMLLSLAPAKADPKRAAYFLSATPCGVFQDTAEKRTFSIRLLYIPTREEILAKEDQLPVTKVSVFRGAVQDVTGASVPNTKIEVVDMKTTGKRRTILLYSDANGKFTADLPNGDYVVTFYFQGFRQRVLHLAITGAENANELFVELQIEAN